MKCIKTIMDQIVRITDEKAAEMVRNGHGFYVNKAIWKRTRKENK